MADAIVSQDRPIIKRAAAQASGLKRYFTGKPCKHGHVAERQVSDKQCLDCKRAYKQSPEGKAVSEAWMRAWRERNPEKNKATRRVWYEKNAERVRAKGRSYRRAWYAKNQLKAKASVAEYRRLNRDSVRAALRNNKARRKGAEGRHTKHDIAALMKTQRSRCAHPWCKRSLKAAYHIDHVMPIALGGSNDRFNLQLLCPTCNLRKRAKHPIDFAQENGLLL